MKAKLMSISLIFVSALGFAAWAFCQNIFVNSRDNANDDTRLLFPVVVPILAGAMVSVWYFISLKHFPGSFLIASLKVPLNLLLLIGSSLGLAVAYFLFTRSITTDPKNIALIPILNTLFLTLIAFVVIYKDGHFERPKPSSIEITGAVITVVGVVMMKFGNASWKR